MEPDYEATTTYLERRRTVEARDERDGSGEVTGKVIVDHGDGTQDVLTRADFHAKYELPRQRAAAQSTEPTPQA